MSTPDYVHRNTSMSQQSNNNNNDNNNSTLSRRSVASLFSNYLDPNSEEDDIDEVVQAPKRLALQDSNISRYEKEFLELSRIGNLHLGLGL